MADVYKRQVVTGCVTTAAAKACLMMPASKEKAGAGLAAVCEALGIPPVLHLSLIHILVRKYFNPDQGAVLVDGVNLADIRRESYFRHIANVEQQVFLRCV